MLLSPPPSNMERAQDWLSELTDGPWLKTALLPIIALGFLLLIGLVMMGSMSRRRRVVTWQMAEDARPLVGTHAGRARDDSPWVSSFKD